MNRSLKVYFFGRADWFFSLNSDGTFDGEVPSNLSGSRMKYYRNLGFSMLGAVVVLATVGYYYSAPKATSILLDVDREDGTTALINAVLVARADKISTQEASDVLGIDPKLPFLGVSAYQSKRRHTAKSLPQSLSPTQAIQSLWMPKQLQLGKRIGASPALFQSLNIDPSTQFCSDAADCLRNEDYFKQVFIISLWIINLI